MSAGWKRRAVGLALALLAVWPLAHHALAARYGFDPWLFFGWSMYALPDPRVELRFAEVRDGVTKVVELPPELAERARAYADRRAALGGLLPPERLARDYLARRPGVDELVIGIRRFELDRRTARIVPHDTVHRFPR